MDDLRSNVGQSADEEENCRFVRIAIPASVEFSVNVAGSDDPYQNFLVNGLLFDDGWRLVQALIRPRDVFFDCGANIGAFSIPAAWRGAEVHAFELLQANVQHLRRAAAKNRLNSIFIVEGAVSDSDGTVGAVGYSAWGVAQKGAGTIPSIALDTYVREQGIGHVDLVKIDIEGSEKDALQGMRRLLTRDHPDLVIEANVLTCGNKGYAYRELLSILARFGYQLYRIDGCKLRPWGLTSTQEIICTDYYATIKSAQEISARTGWPIVPLTGEEVIDNIMRQDRCGDVHKQYILAVENLLPREIVRDERIAEKIAKWRPLHNDEVSRVLTIGVGSPELAPKP